MWKVLKTDQPITEEQVVKLAAEGWELKICVPWESNLYWYFAGTN